MKTFFIKYKLLIPVIILSFLCVMTLITFIRGTVKMDGIVYNGFILTGKHYGAFIAVALSLISFFFLKQFFRYIFLLTLMLGLFGAINFTALEHSWALTLGPLVVSIQPSAFLVSLLTLGLALYHNNTGSHISPEHATVEVPLHIVKRHKEEVEKFKNIYVDKNTEELTRIIIEKKYTAAALEAAQDVLNERQ